nr:hypothetical protein [Salmonella enterica]
MLLFLLRRLTRRGINSPTVRTVGELFHGRPDPLPDAVNSPQAAGNGHHRGALPVPSVREGALLCPVLSSVTASMLWPVFLITPLISF